MQSTDIFIVICRIRTARPSALAAACNLSLGERQPECATQNDGAGKPRRQRKSGATREKYVAPLSSYSKTKRRLLVVFGLEDFTTTVEAVRADVVTQVRFTGRWLDTQLRRDQEVVRAVHTALGWGLLILLNCHDDS
jgi:hypothetical protein